MTDSDVDAVDRLAERAFEAGRHEQGVAIGPIPQLGGRENLTRHLLAVDPGGAWVADRGDGPVGVAQALQREDVWLLSLLAVDPREQSAGTGGALLRQALQYGEHCSGRLLISSRDARAMRSYARSGFALHPTLGASGVTDRSVLPARGAVRDGDETDLDLVEEVDRAVRGGPHGPDAEALLRAGCRLSVGEADGHRGYAFHRAGQVFLLAATVTTLAADLLWECLADHGADGTDARVAFMTGEQQWAIEVVVRAGLVLEPMGPLCRSGSLGPLTPYLPNGPLL